MKDFLIYKYLKIFAINVGVFMVLVIIAEVIFGNWVFGPKFGFLNIPRNAKYYYNVDGLYDNGGRPIIYRRDHLGLRGNYDDLTKIDILTIGGSTTNQLYIDERETWQHHLKTNFSVSGRNVTIVNAGVDGQSTRGHVAIFDRWLAQIKGLKVKYVLAYVGVNDIHVEYAELGDQMQSNEQLRRIRHFILNNSSLYNLFRTIRGYYRAKSAKLIHGAKPRKIVKWIEVQPFNTRVAYPFEYAQRLKDYKYRLQKLIKRIRRFGSTPIIVTQHASVYRIRDKKVYFPMNASKQEKQWSYQLVRSFNNMSMHVCKSYKAICIDLARDLVFHPDDYYDHVHNTPNGTYKIAQYLYIQLKTLFQ